MLVQNMIMHQQLINSGPNQDSFRTCLAILLGYKDVKMVPNFKKRGESAGANLDTWLSERLLSMIHMRIRTYDELLLFCIDAPNNLILMSGFVVGSKDERQTVLCGTKNQSISHIHNPSTPERRIDYSRGDFSLYIVVGKLN